MIYLSESRSQAVTSVSIQRIILHMDIDYYYAQVEILKNPELKGKPLIVGNPSARETGRGVVLTASYEAREFGIHSGQPMIEALKNCPHAEIVKGSRGEYRKISDRLMQILKDYGTTVRVTSIDEAYMDITELVDGFKGTEAFAKELRAEILAKEGLTVSVGIAPTRVLAKMASDYRKPDSYTIVLPSGIEAFLWNQKLKKIPGIGPKTAQKLQDQGYEYCKDVIGKSPAELLSIFGSWGEYFQRLVQGRTSSDLSSTHVRKSMSNERTFHLPVGDVDGYLQYVDNIFEITYQHLLDSDWYTRTVNVKIRFKKKWETITRSRSLMFPTQDRDALYRMAYDLIEPHLEDPRGLRLLGIGFSNLSKLDTRYIPLDEFF